MRGAVAEGEYGVFVQRTQFADMACSIARTLDVVGERVAYSERPVRHEYRLTSKGVELCDLLLVIVRW